MEKTPGDPVSKICEQFSIDIAGDLESNPELITRLAKLDESGTTEQHISEAGASYTFFQIDYYEDDNKLASRTVAAILPGNRTELAYWTEAAPSMTLDIHRGRGRLIIGDPSNGTTEDLPFDSRNDKKVTLPSGCFYTIQADKDSVEPLVISGFHKPPPNWDELEIPLNPGQDSVNAPEGVKQVPSDFRAACDVS